MANNKKSGGCMAGTEIGDSIVSEARPAIGNSIAKKAAAKVGKSKAKKKRSR